jgi:hypothetical protein
VTDERRRPISLTPVATFPSALEASLCKRTLTESGIEAWLPTEQFASPTTPPAGAFGVDVLVRDGDVPAARQVLGELAHGTGSQAGLEPCPRCGATDTDRVDSPAATRPSWLCSRCGHEWT